MSTPLPVRGLVLLALLAAQAWSQQPPPDLPPASIVAPRDVSVPRITAPGAPLTPGRTPDLTQAAHSPAESPPPRDLSPWGMYQAADVVVRSVMIGLAFASLLTWTVLIAKSIEILAAKMRLRRALTAILRARDLGEAERAVGGGRGPAAAMQRATRSETSVSAATLPLGGGQGLFQRVASHLQGVEAQAGRRLSVGIGLLASIGSTAPFVGLFGTAWGIMNAFIGISESQTTSLAVVAPGIAEALLATALGLDAAIPAVVIYNVFARSISGYRMMLGDAPPGSIGWSAATSTTAA